MITAPMPNQKHKPRSMDVNRLVKVSKYAEIKGVTRKTVYEWIEGKIEGKEVKGVTIGGVMFVQLTDKELEELNK